MPSPVDLTIRQLTELAMQISACLLCMADRQSQVEEAMKRTTDVMDQIKLDELLDGVKENKQILIDYLSSIRKEAYNRMTPEEKQRVDKIEKEVRLEEELTKVVDPEMAKNAQFN